MFDLEQSIAQWRKQMLTAGINPTPLVELENHLREDFERQVKSGMPQPDAFKIAVEHIGSGATIRSEFKKAGDPIAIKFLKLVGLAFTVIAGFFGLMFLSKLFGHTSGVGPKLAGLAAVAAILMSWRYSHKFLPAIRHQWVRAAIGAGCCIAAMLGMRYFVVDFLPDSLARAVETDKSLAWFIVSFLWVWSAFAILGGLIHGLEKAAHKHEARYV